MNSNLSNKWPLLTKIFIISSFDFEPLRYNDIKNEFNQPNVEFICPTYKDTITNDIYNYYVKDNTRLLPWNRILYKSELSLILNHIAVLKNIEENYTDGIFLILESDVTKLHDFSDDKFNFFLEMIEKMKNENNYEWDLISLSFYPKENSGNSSSSEKNSLISKKNMNNTDSLMWSYSGVKKFLKLLEKENGYNLPIDFIIYEIINKYSEFKYYWSLNPFFLQKSIHLDGLSSIR